ncbi:F-box protein At5g65850-like [Cornus florida]|uniref:F-box protein At5g65850-like n=1 Tax=Cornus florida TaxID=4283 RepID=UPI00289ECC1E|nr:F-box protein At5g65850-like [Cornus florida]
MTVPREIISEILKHLPVKTLLRLRCVSKLWCSVIDDPLFVDLHHSFSQTQPGRINLLVAAFVTLCTVDPKGSPAIDILDLSELDHDHELNLENPTDESGFPTPIQSVNGLVCTSNSILNPSRRESKALPPMKTADIMPVVPLGVNKYKTLSQCYLGFDSSSKKYKVVSMFCINTRRKDRSLEIGDVRYKIMTLGTDHSWRDIDSVPHQLNRFYVERQFCYVADVIYCLGKINESRKINDWSDLPVIVAFEVRNEKFGIIPLPQGTTGIGFCDRDTASRSIAYSIQVGEHLALIDTCVTTIWILEDYTKQVWSRHSIILPSCYTADENELFLTPVGTIHTGEILIKVSSRLSELSELLYYNLERKTLRTTAKVKIVARGHYHCRGKQSLDDEAGPSHAQETTPPQSLVDSCLQSSDGASSSQGDAEDEHIPSPPPQPA